MHGPQVTAAEYLADPVCGMEIKVERLEIEELQVDHGSHAVALINATNHLQRFEDSEDQSESSSSNSPSTPAIGVLANPRPPNCVQVQMHQEMHPHSSDHAFSSSHVRAALARCGAAADQEHGHHDRGCSISAARTASCAAHNESSSHQLGTEEYATLSGTGGLIQDAAMHRQQSTVAAPESGAATTQAASLEADTVAQGSTALICTSTSGDTTSADGKRTDVGKVPQLSLDPQSPSQDCAGSNLDLQDHIGDLTYDHSQSRACQLAALDSKLPETFKKTQSLGDEKDCEPETCPICLEDLLPPCTAAFGQRHAGAEKREGQLEVVTLGCRHQMHLACLLPYVVPEFQPYEDENPPNQRCPLCRASVSMELLLVLASIHKASDIHCQSDVLRPFRRQVRRPMAGVRGTGLDRIRVHSREPHRDRTLFSTGVHVSPLSHLGGSMAPGRPFSQRRQRQEAELAGPINWSLEQRNHFGANAVPLHGTDRQYTPLGSPVARHQSSAAHLRRMLGLSNSASRNSGAALQHNASARRGAFSRQDMAAREASHYGHEGSQAEPLTPSSQSEFRRNIAQLSSFSTHATWHASVVSPSGPPGAATGRPGAIQPLPPGTAGPEPVHLDLPPNLRAEYHHPIASFGLVMGRRGSEAVSGIAGTRTHPGHHSMTAGDVMVQAPASAAAPYAAALGEDQLLVVGGNRDRSLSRRRGQGGRRIWRF